jgi:hypothetical protein
VASILLLSMSLGTQEQRSNDFRHLLKPVQIELAQFPSVAAARPIRAARAF